MADKGMRKILVVDDDESVRSLCSEALTLAGYRVVTARDGMDAIGMLRRSVYDMVISDVNMPRLDGMSLYARILKDHPYIKDRFLFVSGSPTEELHNMLSETGVENLKKPFTLSALMDRVDSVLSGALKASEGGGPGGAVYKRGEDRVSWKARCELSGGEGWRRKTLAADTDNISRCGVKLRLGAGPLRAGMTLNVTLATGLPGHIPGHTLVIERAARVVWSRAVGKRASEAGVIFSEPVPASDITALSRPAGPAS
ncbi:MAG: response regulator [Thermodesulfobacteriota bacterium]